jgi:peroxiredoxin
MPSLDWQVVAEIATTVSTVAFAASAIVVVLQLRQAARERYFSVTAHLFEIWQSPEFQHDQLFLLHKLPGLTWEDFCALGRGEHAERAIHRVGGYYDRIGNLVRHGLIQKNDILPTIGGYAVAVWHHIEPLVKELRLRENALLFENYEALLPECRECYVPGIERQVTRNATPAIVPMNPTVGQINALPPPQSTQEPVSTNGAPSAWAEWAGGRSKQHKMEVRLPKSASDVPLPFALEFSLPDTDGITHDLSEFTAAGPAVLVYARGAWCPFCLRQLSDYAERYRDFRQSGIEVVAISPESPRRSRRLRAGLKLPFTVLSDSDLKAARKLGLIDREKPGTPTPATLVLDNQGRVKLSTLDQGTKSLVARDTLEYVVALKKGSAEHSTPVPKVESPKPGFLFAKALANRAAGLLIR